MTPSMLCDAVPMVTSVGFCGGGDEDGEVDGEVDGDVDGDEDGEVDGEVDGLGDGVGPPTTSRTVRTAVVDGRLLNQSANAVNVLTETAVEAQPEQTRWKRIGTQPPPPFSAWVT